MAQNRNAKKKNAKRRKRKERKRNGQFEVIEGGNSAAGIDSPSAEDVPDIAEYTYTDWLDKSYTWHKCRVLFPLLGLIMLLVGLIAMWFSPTVGWDALVATTVCKAICAVGSLAVFVPIAMSIVFRHRYGANETARGKVFTAAAYLGLLLTGLVSFVSIGFTLLGLQDVAAGKDEQALAAASYAGHNTFLGTEVNAIYLGADGSLIFCRKGTDAYDLIPEKLKDGADLNVTLYGNSKTLIDVKEVVKKDESKYKLPSIADGTEGDAATDTVADTEAGANGTAESEQAE